MKQYRILAQLIVMVVVNIAVCGVARAQHNFQRTVIVDPSGNADETTIANALTRVGSNPTARWTIFINAGVYAESVSLGGTKENVDLIGVDRNSVIINPAAGGNGITITSGTETSRNNAIRNLTIITTSGHGIEIVQGDQVPRNISVEGVTISAFGSDKLGITGYDAEDVRIFDCNVTTNDADGVKVGHRWTFDTVSVRTDDEDPFDHDGVVVDDRDGITFNNCDLFGSGRCLFLDAAEDIVVQNSRLLSTGAGGAFHANLCFFPLCKRVLVQSCLIVSDATDTSRDTPRAVFFDGINQDPVEEVVFESCRIATIGGAGTVDAVAIQVDIPGNPRFVNCEISAVHKRTSISADAVGLRGEATILGGSITTSSAAEKETEVWDIEKRTEPTETVSVSGTRFSKWHGPLFSAERPRSTIQRTLNVSAASSTAVLAATNLTSSEQTITTGITSPDVYRVLSVTGNQLNMGQNVYVVGTDFAGNAMTDKITLNGTLTVSGVKPFRTVTKIILPAQPAGPQQTVSVGTTSKLGLQFPISATGDVLQQGRKASAATSYTIETVGMVNATYSTVNVGTVTAGDSFEWAAMANQ